MVGNATKRMLARIENDYSPSAMKYKQMLKGVQPRKSGPGSELKKLLGKIGITESEGCGCKSRAAEMDRNGVEWCENNIELILDWLEEAARDRGLPYVRAGARIIVKRAIRNAK